MTDKTIHPFGRADYPLPTKVEAGISYAFGRKVGTLVAGGSPQLPVTRQTTSYATGDDGNLESGNNPVPRFTDNGDGTVTDNATGLQWMKDQSSLIEGAALPPYFYPTTSPCKDDSLVHFPFDDNDTYCRGYVRGGLAVTGTATNGTPHVAGSIDYARAFATNARVVADPPGGFAVNTLTLSFRIKTTGANMTVWAYTRYDGIYQDRGGFHIKLDAAGKVQVVLTDGATGATIVSVTSNTAVNDNAWHVVTIVLTGTVPSIQIYLGKTLDQTGAGSNISWPFAPNSRIYFGSNAAATGYLSGVLDDAHWYTRALTQDEIDNLVDYGQAQVYTSTLLGFRGTYAFNTAYLPGDVIGVNPDGSNWNMPMAWANGSYSTGQIVTRDGWTWRSTQDNNWNTPGLDGMGTGWEAVQSHEAVYVCLTAFTSHSEPPAWQDNTLYHVDDWVSTGGGSYWRCTVEHTSSGGMMDYGKFTYAQPHGAYFNTYDLANCRQLTLTASAHSALPIGMSFTDALTTIAAINAAGGVASHTDWRLPNILEIMSVINFEAAANPIIGNTVTTLLFPFASWANVVSNSGIMMLSSTAYRPSSPADYCYAARSSIYAMSVSYYYSKAAPMLPLFVRNA
ncbi:MAG: LamG-like jellyroll fold domain-containing protein [Armatimonadota bacterium]